MAFSTLSNGVGSCSTQNSDIADIKLSYCFSSGCETEVKNTVRCINLSEPSHRCTQWVELAQMGTPRIAHGLVEAG